MKKEKLINSICELVEKSNKPLNQKLDIWGKLDSSTVKELKEIESKLTADIFKDLHIRARKVQGY